jgi:hypothetical protein
MKKHLVKESALDSARSCVETARARVDRLVLDNCEQDRLVSESNWRVVPIVMECDAREIISSGRIVTVKSMYELYVDKYGDSRRYKEVLSKARGIDRSIWLRKADAVAAHEHVVWVAKINKVANNRAISQACLFESGALDAIDRISDL